MAILEHERPEMRSAELSAVHTLDFASERRSVQSPYLFADRFGRPGKGNDKGKVEGLVGYARR